MKKLILFILGLYCSTYLAIATENKLIRLDRVWELNSLFYDYDEIEHGNNPIGVMNYTKFGYPEIIDGKEYYPVITFKKVYNDIINSTIEIRDNLNLVQAWLREENGKVFMHIDETMTNTFIDIPDEYKNLNEGIIYDFNATEGDSYIGLTMRCEQDWDDSNKPIDYAFVSYRVTKVEIIEIENTPHKVQTVVVEYSDNGDLYQTREYKIIEGIGILEYGGLFYLETMFNTSDMRSYFQFCRYFNNKGDLLYGEEYPEKTPMDQRFTNINNIFDYDYKSDELSIHYYNLQGFEVSKPKSGDILICTNGLESKKIFIP